MFGIFKQRAGKIGRPPGTLTYVGTDKTFTPSLEYICYDTESFRHVCPEDPAQVDRSKAGVHWLIVKGVHYAGLLQEVGGNFGLHPLTVEDIMNTSLVPKTEEFDEVLFFVFKYPEFNEDEAVMEVEQVAVVAGPDFVLTFQESEKPLFEPIIRRIQKEQSRLRRFGVDYLLTAVLDRTADGFYIISDRVGRAVDRLEEAIIRDQNEETLLEVYTLKRELLLLRNTLPSAAEVLSFLARQEVVTITESVAPFLRDAGDHLRQGAEEIKVLHETAAGLLDVYVSLTGLKMNQIMKVLTIIATIFIPLTFIAGIYGMNFQYMPELEYKWAYPAVLGFMAAAAGGMVYYFIRRKWL